MPLSLFDSITEAALELPKPDEIDLVQEVKNHPAPIDFSWPYLDRAMK